MHRGFILGSRLHAMVTNGVVFESICNLLVVSLLDGAWWKAYSFVKMGLTVAEA